MRYQCISAHKDTYPVQAMCQSLGVSRSGYYAYERAPMSQRKKEDMALLDQIIESHKQSRKTYGSPRVTSDIRDLGKCVGKNRIARLMREHGIKAKKIKKYKHTTQSNHNRPLAPDLVRQQFSCDGPDKIWASDITYIKTGQGWLYLCIFMDLFSRRMVGWAMDKHMEADLVTRAFDMACNQRTPNKGLIVHSDRGVQYTSAAFRRKLIATGARQSMGRKGNCYDNACCESFFHTLKTEEVYFNRYRTRVEARASIFEYIEGWYNIKRRHSTLGYKVPSQFELLKRAS